MGKRYTEEELVQIAEQLVDDLRECEDGTSITTCQLLKLAGYEIDAFDTYDLFKIHDALFRAARKNCITLDMSSHKNKVEGLPFCLDFVIRNKKAQNNE